MASPKTPKPLNLRGRRTEFDMPIVSVSSPESESAAELPKVTEQNEKVPPHYQVLYDLMGESAAESILNPKMEEPVSGRRSSMKQEGKHLRSVFPNIDTGIGADALWKLLKEKSSAKLTKMDNKIPADWKASYASFMREEISKQHPLSFRSFTGEDDVPEYKVLMKNDYEAKVRKIRSHSNIMHRAAVNNQNRATLLLNNNPLPQAQQKDKTLKRFFDDSHFAGSSGSRMIKRSESTDSFQRKRDKLFANLNYLTEKKATVPGTFYAKYDNQTQMKMVTDIPGYKVKLPPHMTARVTVSAPAHNPPIEWKRFEKAQQSKKREPKWQPLTAGALVEYTETKPILGSGQFSHGRSNTWVASRSVSV